MTNDVESTTPLPLLCREDLNGKWAEQDGTGLCTMGGSRHRKQRDQFNTDVDSDKNVGIVLCGVRHPSNVGAIIRSCSCFGVSRLLHLHSAANNNTNKRYWSEPHIVATLQSCSVGTLSRFQQADGAPFQSISIDNFVVSRPLVVMEAIAGAISIYEYKFPEHCDVMVGSEHKGITTDILKALRKDVDAVVYVPMQGPHHSLNVASALTIALYEYRRQWPGRME